MPVWCHRCAREYDEPAIYRRRAMSVPEERCPGCDVLLDDIVPNWKDRLSAAKVGQAGRYDPEEGKKWTTR